MSKFFKKTSSSTPKLSSEKNHVFAKFIADTLEAARRSENLDTKRFLSRIKGLHTASSVFLRSQESHEEKNVGAIENRLKEKKNNFC